LKKKILRPRVEISCRSFTAVPFYSMLFLSMAPARASDDDYMVRGYCALCTAHCATVATVQNGRVVRLDPDHDHPNGGVMCIKGKAAPELVYHSDRLNYPLKHTRPKGDLDPGWKRIRGEQALDGIAEKLLEVRERYGPQAIGLAKESRRGTSVDDAERWPGDCLLADRFEMILSTTNKSVPCFRHTV